MNAIWGAFVAVGALSAFALLVVALRRWPALGASLLALCALSAWEFPNPPALFEAAEASVYAFDVLSAALFMAAILSWGVVLRNVGAPVWLWFAMFVGLLASLAFGISANGFGLAFTEFRPFFYTFAVITWGMSINWAPPRSGVFLEIFAYSVGWGLVLIAAYHMTLFGVGGATELILADDGETQTSRPLVSGQALMLLLSLVVVFARWGRTRRFADMVTIVVFLMVIVIVQQRTVWGVAAAIAVVLLFFGSVHFKRALIVGGIFSALAVGYLLVSSESFDVVEALGESFTNTGTYNGRLNSWNALLERAWNQGASTVIFGAPFGSGFGRFEGAGRWVDFAPHNWYLTIYLRIGIIGLLAFSVFMMMIIIKSVQRRRDPVALATVTAMMVYGWSYSWLWYTSLFLAWTFATVNAQQPRDAIEVLDTKPPPALLSRMPAPLERKGRP